MVPPVYELLQELKGDAQIRRLLERLDDLAGRIECITSSDTPVPQTGVGTVAVLLGGLPHPAQSTTSGAPATPETITLPHPSPGALSVFPGASEYSALQAAVDQVSSRLKLQSQEARWAVKPAHAALVAAMAWHTCAAVYQPDHPRSLLLQEAVFQQMEQLHVSFVLSGSMRDWGQGDQAYSLLLQAIANATCRLLRKVFPASSEQFGKPLAAAINNQLRLWTAGVLPQDAGALEGLAVDAAAAGACTNEAKGPDPSILATRPRRILHQQQAALSDCVRCKPGHLVSHFMSQRGLSPSSVWQHRLAHGDKHNVALAGAAAAVAASGWGVDVGDEGSGQLGGSGKALAGQPCVIRGGAASVAAQCLEDAAAAVDKYEKSKKTAAAWRYKQAMALQQQQRHLEQQQQLVSKSTARRQGVSNTVSGWMDTSPYSVTAHLTVSVTDAQCKAQRQRAEQAMRPLDGSLASLRVKKLGKNSLDMAAALAAKPAAATGQAGAASSLLNGWKVGS